MSHVISMHLPDDPRQIVASDLPKVIPCLVAPSFGHSILVVRAKQHDPSAMTALKSVKIWVRSKNFGPGGL
jgi:hypothetical protein